MRLDTRVSRDTRIEVVTEGVLTRMLQSDPSLEGVAAVIFDEFHERSLQADLGLALTIDARENLTPDLQAARDVRDAGRRARGGSCWAMRPSSRRRGGCFRSRRDCRQGRAACCLTPPRRVGQRVARSGWWRRSCHARAERRAGRRARVPARRARDPARADAAARAMQASDGLRSVSTVAAVRRAVRGRPGRRARARCAMARARWCWRRTSRRPVSRFQGVRVVVDSGLVRRSLFDPSTGMSRLETQRISRASADQRQGRAGRVEPGVCYRAWSEGAQRSLAPFSTPEIAEADLAPLALDLANWGARDATDLRWLDAPPAPMLASARDLLMRLGALDAQGRITPHGREMAQLGVHPRLAHMLLRARALDSVRARRRLRRASERTRSPPRGCRARAMRTFARASTRCAAIARPPTSTAALLERARRMSRELARTRLGERDGDAGRRVRCRRAARVCLSRSHRPPPRRAVTRVTRSPMAAARTSPKRRVSGGRSSSSPSTSTIASATRASCWPRPSRARTSKRISPIASSARESVAWNSREQAVTARRVLRLDALVLEEQPLPQVPAGRGACRHAGGHPRARHRRAALDPRRARPAGPHGVRSQARRPRRDVAGGGRCIARRIARHLARTLARRHHPPRSSLATATRPTRCARCFRTISSAASTSSRPVISKCPPARASASTISTRARLWSRCACRKCSASKESPRLGGGRVPITFKLLSPAQRPVQVTRDLAGFWRGTYADVRKDMRGRYPKHYWPENPLEAEPTRGVRRRT